MTTNDFIFCDSCHKYVFFAVPVHHKAQVDEYDPDVWGMVTVYWCLRCFQKSLDKLKE